MILNAAFIFCLISHISASIQSDSKLTKRNVVEEDCIEYTVYPISYDIVITPCIYLQKKWEYQVDMKIRVLAKAEGVNTIVLDAKDITIQDGDIRVLYKNQNVLKSFRVDGEKLHLNLRNAMFPYVKNFREDVYVIQISFKKQVNFASEGILFLPYEDKGTKYLFATRLSPNKAHYFFPCFNNPHFESVYTFKVREPQSEQYFQYANTSLVISKEQMRENQRDYVTVQYLPSKQIAPYQVGFHYSQFGKSRPIQVKSDTFYVWAQTNNLHYYDYILMFCDHMSNLIIDYSTCSKEFRYRPLVDGPINIVSVPKVRHLDGYEIGSWNLLTNSEYRLFYSQDFTSIDQKERMNYDLTLQLCRIWLGNPGEEKRTKWKEEWFKEGVATYLAHFFMTQYQHKQQGAWSLESQVPLSIYGLRMKFKAMAEDWGGSPKVLILKDLKNTPAVEIPDTIIELVQMKTASLLLMIENWVGSEKFHKAFLKYINIRRGQTISLLDFTSFLDQETVDCLEQFTKGVTATKILDSWLSYGGYPVITVNVFRASGPEQHDIIQLKQEKFSFTQPVNVGEPPRLIAVTYIKENSKNCFNCAMPKYAMETESNTFMDNLNGGWIILNVNASAYYRVNYDDYTWGSIAKTLMEKKDIIPEENRAQIVNDVFALYAAGHMKEEMAIYILAYLRREKSPIVWEAAIYGFEYLKVEGARCNMTQNLYKAWQNFMSEKVTDIYADLALKDMKDDSSRIFRRNLVMFACTVEHQPCINIMNKCTNDRRVEADTRETCYEVKCKEEPSYCTHSSFNKWEVEDKLIAESKLKNDYAFKAKLQQGSPVSDFQVNSTAPPMQLVLNNTTLHPDRPDSGWSMAPTATLFVCASIISVLRYEMIL